MINLRLRLPSRFTLLFAAILIAAPAIAHASSSGPPVDEGDFSDFLVARDLVVTGTVVHSEIVEHPRSGGCGYSNLGSIRGRMLTVKPDAVLLGSLATETVQVFSYGDDRTASQVDRPGQRVILFGVRPCDDPTTLWGDAVVIGERGSLRPTHEQRVGLAGVSRSPTAVEVLAALERKRFRRGDAALEGSGGAALVRVTAVTPRLPKGYAIAIAPVRWVAGTPTELPETVTFEAIPQCGGVVVGDELLLPVPPGFQGATLAARWCPSRLIVRDGRVPLLATHLDRIDEVIQRDNGRLRVLHDRRRP